MPYADVVAVARKLDGEIATIGTLHNSSDPAGIAGASAIAEVAESLGLTVVARGYIDVASMSLAAESLIENGAQAIVLPNESRRRPGFEHGAASRDERQRDSHHRRVRRSGLCRGVDRRSGSINHYHWGVNIGRLLVAHLQGELDIATAAIAPASLALSMGVNLSAAQEANIEIPASLLAEADFHLTGFLSDLTEKGKRNRWHLESMRALGAFLERFTTPETYAFVQEAELPDLREGQAEFIESARCTPERIAEEQAALDAADG